MLRLELPCECTAYPFPHRPNSGDCTGPGPAPESCKDCTHSVHTVDPYGVAAEFVGEAAFATYECRLIGPCPWGKINV